MRSDATFIGIEVDDAADAQALEDACPVDIFANEGGHVAIVDKNIDECILCELCIQAAPGKVRVHKLYSGETLG